jgi:hypothetical protein
MPNRTTRKLKNAIHTAVLRHEFWKKQTGGAIVSVPGARYDYRESMNRNRVVIRGGRKAGQTECFLLIFDTDGSASLQGLKQADDCALDDGATGRHMVMAALKIVRDRGAHTLHLDDEAKKKFPSGKSFHLSTVYFLTHGMTWYESIIPGLYPLEKQDKIKMWRETVHTNRWVDVAAQLHLRGVPTVSSEWTEGIDITAPGSAMQVLRRIKDAHTDFFADYEDEIVGASFAGKLSPISWEAKM